MFRKHLIIFALLVFVLAACMSGNQSGTVTAESEESQSVIVTGIPSLKVNHFAGTISVKNGEDGKITANLTRQSRSRDETDAQAQLEQIEMAFTQSGLEVELSVDAPDNFAELTTGPTAELELLVPMGTHLDLNLGAGVITADQPAGDLTINSGAGEVTVTMPADASFRVMITGGAAGVDSEFEGIPNGGVAVDIDRTVGDNPTQTLTINVGAGAINLRKAP